VSIYDYDVLISGQPGDGLGVAAAVGNFDGDPNDLEDLAVSGTGPNGDGRIYVIPHDVLVGSHSINLADPGQRAMVLEIDGSAGEGLGTTLAAARFAAGAAADNVLAYATAGGPGAVYAFFGGPAAARGVRSTTSVPDAQSFVVTPPSGTVISSFSVGDLDGGGNDLLLGGHNASGGLIGFISGTALVPASAIMLAITAHTTGSQQFGTAITWVSKIASIFNLVAGSPGEGRILGYKLSVAANVLSVGTPIFDVHGSLGFGGSFAVAPYLPTDTVVHLVAGDARLNGKGEVYFLTYDRLTGVIPQVSTASGVTKFTRDDLVNLGQQVIADTSLYTIALGADFPGQSRGFASVHGITCNPVTSVTKCP
jgi:hypothetical protein